MTFDEQRARIRQLEKQAKNADDDLVLFIWMCLAIPALFVCGAIVSAFWPS